MFTPFYRIQQVIYTNINGTDENVVKKEIIMELSDFEAKVRFSSFFFGKLPRIIRFGRWKFRSAAG